MIGAAFLPLLLAAASAAPGPDLDWTRRRRCPSGCPMCSDDPPVTTRTLFDGDRRAGWTVWRRDGGLDTLIGYVLDRHPDDEDVAELHRAALRVLDRFLTGYCDDGIAEDCEGDGWNAEDCDAVQAVTRKHGVSMLPPMSRLSGWIGDYEERPDGMVPPASLSERVWKPSSAPRWGWQKKHADPVKKAKRKAAEKAKRANRGRR